MSVAAPAASQQPDPKRFNASGIILNSVGDWCPYTQTYDDAEATRTIRFDNPGCMSSEADGPENARLNESINMHLIADQIVSWMTGERGYYRQNADFDTQTFYRPNPRGSISQLNGKELCMRSDRYPTAGITVEFFSNGSSITGASYAQALLGCETEVVRQPLPRLETAGGAAEQSPPCDITGNVPDVLRPLLCTVATSVHGGDAPVNQLTVTVDRDIADAIRARMSEAENMLLNMLDAWMTQRGVRVASVEVFYGRAHLATVETHVWRAPSVTFH